MEGVTDISFRGLVLDHNPGAVGAACTQFLRVSQVPMPVERIQRELGPPHESTVPVGVQLMGNLPDILAESAVRAADIGAPFVDLNFGCPAPKVFQHRAGSALLAEPVLLEQIVRAVADACPVPVTAKIRSGIECDTQLEDICRRVEQAGAALLTVHGRLRQQSYREPPDWSRIARAVAAVDIPVIGNGSADTPELIEQMFAQTGCAGVMVGRATIGNPWLFADWRDFLAAGSTPEDASTPPPAPRDIAAWLLEYQHRMQTGGATECQALGRLKQVLKAMIAGGLLPEGGRRQALRSRSAAEFHAIALGGEA